jgi:serine/threonine-protein kinase
MRLVTVDTEGRLVELSVVPPQTEPPQATPVPETDWTRLFELAGLDRAAFQPVTPEWTPREYSDRRAAWEGPLPGWPDQRLRIEAAAYRGRPVHFQMVAPWTQPDRMREAPSSRSRVWQQTIVSIAIVIVLVGALLVARHNLRKGKGDRRGADRIALATLAAMLLAWLTGSRHIAEAQTEMVRLFTAVGGALFNAGVLWVLYLALEPYVRRRWPSALVSWSRLVAGSYRDPRVGRDVLIGTLFGIAIVLAGRSDSEIRALFGYPVIPPLVPSVSWLEGVRLMLANVSALVFSATFNSLWITFGIVAVNLIVRRMWITAVVMTLFLLVTSAGNIAESPAVWLALAVNVAVVVAIMFVIMKLGLLATIVMFFVNFILSSAVLTLDTTRWFFPTSATLLLMVASLAAYGFYASRAGEPLLGRRILD